MKTDTLARLRRTRIAGAACLALAALANSTPALAASSANVAAAAAADGFAESATLLVFGAVLAVGAALMRRAQARASGELATPSHPPVLQTQSASPLAR